GRRDCGMAGDPGAPRRLGADTNPDARAPDDGPGLDAAVFEEEAIAEQVECVFGQGDAHRHRQVAGAATQAVAIDRRGRSAAPLHRPRPPAAHDVNSVQRIQRPDQHGRGRAVRLGDDVYEGVDAVVQVDVRMPGVTIERTVTPCRTRRGVAGRIELSDIRLDLD